MATEREIWDMGKYLLRKITVGRLGRIQHTVTGRLWNWTGARATWQIHV